ncbi:hypothetical protein TNCV_3161001 [Trichonephila clavipes]|nr:hypothetical protein TNCV_3161001 [Trichonephila clavipes]
MGTLPSSRRGKCVTLFGGVSTPRNSSACKQQQGHTPGKPTTPRGHARSNFTHVVDRLRIKCPPDLRSRNRNSCLLVDGRPLNLFLVIYPLNALKNWIFRLCGRQAGSLR